MLTRFLSENNSRDSEILEQLCDTIKIYIKLAIIIIPYIEKLSDLKSRTLFSELLKLILSNDHLIQKFNIHFIEIMVIIS